MISPMTYSIEKHFLAFMTFLPIILLEYQTTLQNYGKIKHSNCRHCLLSWLVAVNKMVCHFWHQFLTQFSLLFQVVPFFFLSMAALRTTNTKLSDWLLELFQPIRLWLSELPYRVKWMVPSERALKSESETGVKIVHIILLSVEWKTNSEIVPINSTL